MAHTKSATDHVCGSDLSPDESRVHVESIFKDDKDREVFLKTLGEACVSWGWKAHGFVLMGNHYHLLTETTRHTLVREQGRARKLLVEGTRRLGMASLSGGMTWQRYARTMGSDADTGGNALAGWAIGV